MQKEIYESHLKHQEDHWWFNARQKIIEAILNPYLSGHKDRSILDIGSGGGRFLGYLSRFGRVKAVDPEEKIVTHIKRTYGEDVGQKGDLPHNVPFMPNTIDLITSLDVLEHVENDRAGLETIHSLLVPQGLYFLTVPAFQCLWSYHDVQSHHIRRYTKKDLENKLLAAGFTIKRIGYFNTFLFLPAFLFRRLRFASETKKDDMEAMQGFLGPILERIFLLERKWLRRFNFPFGVSLFAVCRKVS